MATPVKLAALHSMLPLLTAAAALLTAIVPIQAQEPGAKGVTTVAPGASTVMGKPQS
jgi:hypothetical protein